MAAMKSGLGTKKSSRLNRNIVVWLKCLGCIFFTIFFCEFLVYYFVIIQCHWPDLKTSTSPPPSPLKAMFLSDTHLLGEITGHWFDKFRREWQMERAYQSAIWLLQPDIVFILGDLFDEGKWSNSKAWEDDVARFQSMFRHPPHMELLVVVGNHDIGFHYEMTTHKLNRFEKAFNLTSGKVITRKGINFVLVNSVALEGDNCIICRAAEDQILEVSRQLNCSRKHYPLYRKSDSACTGEDSATHEEKKVLFKEKYDVLSQDASQKLLWLIQPRLILSGHTHSACRVLHGSAPEISVPSFSWRNRNNPSFIMGLITDENFSLEKCFLPTENTVIYIYCIAGALGFSAAIVWLPLNFLKSLYATKQKPV
ncbi:metallophosphoesterase 1 isoform X2 [Ranitomeya variabilis]|uniref:metallophosphoesterase 1 isoform X2 n=1 Tax=Ranitomeya variabilis TaxID=490064 RepID=UPI00405644ED